jgi:hypothetical protein
MEDAVPNRQGVQENAMREYSRIMQRRGESQLALDRLETIFPGVNDYAQIDDDLPMLVRRGILMGLWKEISAEEEYHSRYDANIKVADEKGFPWREIPDALMSISLLGDDFETALPAAVEVLNDMNALNYAWKRLEQSPIFYPLLDEPEIVSRIAQFKSDEVRFRGEIEIMLQNPEWAF